MKIIDERPIPKPIYACLVKPGQVFRLIEEPGSVFMRLTRDLEPAERVRAADLATGRVYTFDPQQLVITLNASMVINPSS